MSNEVTNYINQQYSIIYDGKSKRLTPIYIDLIITDYSPIINPDDFIFNILTKIIILRNKYEFGVYVDNDEYKMLVQMLHNYIIDQSNDYHLYRYCNDYYIGSECYEKYSIVSGDKINEILDHILTIPIIVTQPANIDHIYDITNIDFQLLPNCIRDIIYQYSQDIVYTFIKMILEHSGINDESDIKNGYDIIRALNNIDHYHDILYSYTMSCYNDMINYGKYVINDWILLIYTVNNVSVYININANDYMYGIISYTCTEISSDSEYLFIHCIDVINLYNDFIKNQRLPIYKKLRKIDKNFNSFIKYMHNCKYVFDKLLSINITCGTLSERLISFTER